MSGLLLKLEHLEVRYGDLIGVSDVSLDVPEGSVVALLGSNGGGKTTTLNAIAGLIPLYAGSITFRGEDIGGQNAHAIVRKGLRAAIEEDPSMKVVGEAGDGEAALAMIGQLHPVIAVLDIDMPKLDGLGVARELRRQGLETSVLFLTLHTDDDLFRVAIELGCRGYLLKDSATQEIATSLRAVIGDKSASLRRLEQAIAHLLLVEAVTTDDLTQVEGRRV